jgi:exodeoxyribonuclease VII small subunit
MRNKKTLAPAPETGLSFEQAIQRLEQIVAEMEGAELPLDEVLKKYEEGTRLVRFCGQKLEEAEKKIELLTKKSDGTVELKPFQPEAEAEGATPADDDAKLF